MLERMWRKGSPLALLVGMWTDATTLENCVEVPQRVKNRSALRPSKCTAEVLPQRYRSSETPGHLYPDVYSSNGHNSQMWKESWCPSKDEWIKKMWFTYTMEYYSVVRNNKYPPFASTWMELEDIMLSENKSIGEGQTLYGLIHLGNIKNSERK